MNARWTENGVERELRAVLAERRPTSGPPPELVRRVRAIPAASAAELASPHLRLTSVALGLTSVGLVLVAVAAIGVVLLSTQAPGPTTQPTPLPTLPPPNAIGTGPGIVYPPVPDQLHSMPWVIAFVGLVVLALVSARLARAGRVIVLVPAVLLLAGAYVLANHPGPSMGNAYGANVGTERIEVPWPLDGPDGYVVTAPPGEAFMVVFNITNDGLLPMTVLGVEEDVAMSEHRLSWRAVQMHVDPGGGFPAIDQAEPFRAVALQPGVYLNLYLVGQAGPCATGPDWEGVNSGSGATLTTIPIAYSVLGLSASERVQLPFQLIELQRERCPARDG